MRRNHPPHAPRFVHRSGHDRHRLSLLTVRLHQLANHSRIEIGQVSIDDDQSGVTRSSLVQGFQKCMSCPSLGILQCSTDIGIFQMLANLIGSMTHDHREVIGSSRTNLPRNMIQHRYAQDRVQDFGGGRSHAGSATRSKDDGGELIHGLAIPSFAA